MITVAILVLGSLALTERLVQNLVGSDTAASETSAEVTRLAIATLDFDTTATPIDSDQARNLLFLWKGMRSLAASTNPATVEIEGLVEQIKSGLTGDQLAALSALDLRSSSAEYASGTGGAERAAVSSSITGTAPSAQPGGEMPVEGEMPPDDGGMGGDIGAAPIDNATTKTSSTSTRSSSVTVSLTLINDVIQLLAAKIL